MGKTDEKVSVFHRYGSRGLLLVCGLVAVSIATMILFAADYFYAGYGIQVENDVSLANELKAPSGALLLAGLLMLFGAFRPTFVVFSMTTAAAVYLSYGLSRFLSMAIDGVPHNGLVIAAVFEMAIGGICLLDLVRHRVTDIERIVVADGGWSGIAEEENA